MVRESGANLIQIGSQGREMRNAFQATPQLFSTEKECSNTSRVGAICYFFCLNCLNEDAAAWRFFDWRGGRTVPVDRDLLASLI